jgi:thiol-disulfide isomerase/thioredoxin
MRLLEVSLFLAIVSGSTAQATPQDSLIGTEAPRFVRPDLSGKRIDLGDYRGDVVLLNFWATWCGPCLIELPTFSSWQGKYGHQGLQIIAVSMDDDSAPVGKAVRRLHIKVPVIMGDEKLGNEYGGVLGLPVTYLIGRDGRIAARISGETDLKKMESKVRELLSAR